MDAELGSFPIQSNEAELEPQTPLFYPLAPIYEITFCGYAKGTVPQVLDITAAEHDAATSEKLENFVKAAGVVNGRASRINFNLSKGLRERQILAQPTLSRNNNKFEDSTQPIGRMKHFSDPFDTAMSIFVGGL